MKLRLVDEIFEAANLTMNTYFREVYKMKDKNFEVDVPGKFSATEEAILEYFFEHPDENIGTAGLIKVLKLEQSTAGQEQQAYKEIQFGIESLVAARLVKGKRVSESGRVQYVQLRLTAKGEAEAIKQKRRLKKIIFDIPRPARERL